MVGRDAAGQAIEEVVVAEHLQVVRREVAAGTLDVREDLVALLGRREADAGAEALRDRGVAADPAEDEHDGGEQPLAVEAVDDVDPARDPDPTPVADLALPGLLRPSRRTAVLDTRARPVVAGDLEQFVVDRGALLDEAGCGVD